MTIPIKRSTVNIQAQCGVRSGRELFCGDKQKRKGVNTWLALGDSKIDGREGIKKITHTYRHKSAAVTSFQVNSCKMRETASNSKHHKHKDGTKTKNRCKDAEVDVKSTSLLVGEEPV